MEKRYYVSLFQDLEFEVPKDIAQQYSPEDLVVVEETENHQRIVSDKFSTRFVLCPRCIRKEHYGVFDNNVFICNSLLLLSELRGLCSILLGESKKTDHYNEG